MSIRLTLMLAALALAPARARGQGTAAPYSPPQMTWGPAGEPGADPTAATSAAPARSASVGWEWGLGGVVGRRSGWWSPSSPVDPGFAMLPELSLLAHLGAHAVAGAKLTGGLAAGVVGGARVPLGGALRLDVLADAGFTRQELSADETYWAPTFGARAGATWARTGGGAYVTVGVAAVRRVPKGTAQVSCIDGSRCGTVAPGGGTLVGLFLTAGGAHPRDGGSGR